MKIPKNIDKLLTRRTKLANELDDVCYTLDRWLVGNNISPDETCYMGGVEIYVNPKVAEIEVRKAIEEVKQEK